VPPRWPRPFPLARATAHWPVFLLVFAIATATATLVAAFAAFDAQALDRASAARLAGADTSFTFDASSTSPAAYQAAYEAVRADARQNLGSLSFGTDAARWSKPLLYTAVPTSAGVVESFMVATAAENLADHATLEAGSWPQGPKTAQGSKAADPIQVAIPVALAPSSNSASAASSR
jgi:hypothetical protein